MHGSITFPHSLSRQKKPRRQLSSGARYTLLSPPSRLTVEQAAALLHIPRRTIEAELDWLMPAEGEVSDGVRVRERPSLYA